MTLSAFNCRSINNKKVSFNEILNSQNLDIALCSELNLNWKPPRFKGFFSFQKKSKRKFHGLALYISNHLSEAVLRIPDEDDELEVIHVLVKCTIPNLNIIGGYLDVESRQDSVAVERVWSKLVAKIDIALGRGEGVILMGDLNRPLQTPRPSFGTKLLLDWEELGTMVILNKKDIPTRIDPHTKKGSTLDLGVVSVNIRHLISKFEVDTFRKWSPFSIRKLPGGQLEKRFSDHMGIKFELKITKATEEKIKKKEIINFKNEDGWAKYKEESDTSAEVIKRIALDETLSIDEVREQIRAEDEKTQKRCFGTIWVGPKKQKKPKKKPSREINELFKEQYEELNELIETGASYKDVNRRIWKIKELICGPKVGSSEPACINNPETGELITDKTTIKKVSLEHCAKILTKNKIRDCDRKELSAK